MSGPPSRSAEASRDVWSRAFPWGVGLGCAAACAQGLARGTLWKSAEPRIMDVARDQYAHGMFRPLTFADMPFLEEPPFLFDLTAGAFHLAGGPSILAARAVVALLGALWVAAVALTVRRVAGPRAGLLAAALLAVSHALAMLVRRLGVDIALVSMLSLSMLFLSIAVAEDRDRVGGRWWWAALAAAGCAALTKGIFGTFLFVVPTLAYAALARDARVAKAMFRPTTLLALALPHVVWGALLWNSGGATFVFEHFVNNTVGRVLHKRFDVAGTHQLPYGDVGQPYAWYYCLVEVPTSALPAFLVVPFAVAEQRKLGGFRARDARSRLVALALCWGVVPPVVLTFSSYKGRDHLGASAAAFVVVGALWLARRLDESEKADWPRWAKVGVVASYVAAPFLVVAAFFGAPSTETGARVALGVAAAVGFCGIAAALVARRREAACHFLCAATIAAYLADFAPGANRRDDDKDTIDPVARWVAREAQGAPVGVFMPPGDPSKDPVGLADEQAIGSFAYWLDRPIEKLPTPEAVHAFLARTAPVYFVACRGKDRGPLKWPKSDADVGWSATAGNRWDAYTLVANRAAAALRSGPSEPPPDVAVTPGK